MTDLCRRTLLKGAAATCGVGLLAACGGGDDGGVVVEPPASGALAKLDDIAVGTAVGATAPDGSKVLLSRTSETEVVGLSAVCTHQGCTVEAGEDGLACPCHGSVFALDGEVVQGPADAPLRPYAVKVVDGEVLPA